MPEHGEFRDEDLDLHRTSPNMALGAIEAQHNLDLRTDAQILQMVKELMPAWAWQRETVDHYGVACMRVIERTTLPGPDDITPWPVARIGLTRKPWRLQQTPRECRFVFTFDADERPMLAGL